ncbi:hypothetical protein ACFL6T_03015 [Candidatus Zixiibacteriota bacterium]
MTDPTAPTGPSEENRADIIKDGSDVQTDSPFIKVARKTEQAVKDAGEFAGKTAKDIERYAVKTLAENETTILDNCPIFHTIQEHESVFREDPEIYHQLHNLSIKPLLTGAILGVGGGAALAASGAAVLDSDEILSRVTRHIFDGDRFIGGFGKDVISRMIGSDTAQAVNQYMDTVPGSEIMGGGWVHRIQHGHDLASVADVWAEHGSGGAVSALYHMYGRDFFTPAGIPILPAGSDDVYMVLTTDLGMSSQQAADLISINFIELLGGIVTITGIIRMWNAAQNILDDIRVRKLIQQATEALETEDYLSAAAFIDQALSIRPKDPTLGFTQACINQRGGNKLQAHMAYRDVCRWVKNMKEPVQNLGGARISLRGLAAIGALSTGDALMQSEEYRSSWRDHIIELASTAVSAFRTVADVQLRRSRRKRLLNIDLLPGRYLSAAANYYLAGQVAGGSLLLPGRITNLEALAQEYEQCMLRVEQRDSSPALSERLRLLREIGTAQLRPLQL